MMELIVSLNKLNTATTKELWAVVNKVTNVRQDDCGDAFPIEGVLVATYLLSVEALPHCRCGVANKSYMV